MGTTDKLFAPGFPHGTPDGWQQGCRGAACPNHGTDLPTCREAHRRYVGDYQYRRAVDAGETPPSEAAAALAAAESAVAAAAARAARPRPAPAFSPAQDAAARAIAPVPARPPGKGASVSTPAAPDRTGRRLVPHPVVGADGRRHGTMTGYGRGCRKGSPCPATPSCFEVAMDYYAARRRAKRDEATAKEVAPVEVALAVVGIVQPADGDRAGIPAPRDPRPQDPMIALALADPTSVLASDLRAAADAAPVRRAGRLRRLADALDRGSPLERAG